MNHTYSELARFITYIAGIVVGLAFVAYGLVVGDLPTAFAGAAALGVSVTAAPNVPKTDYIAEVSSDSVVVEDE